MINKKYGIVLLGAALLVTVYTMRAAAETDWQCQRCSLVVAVLDKLEKTEERVGYSSKDRLKAQKSLRGILGYRIHFAHPDPSNRICPGPGWYCVFNDVLSREAWFLKESIIRCGDDFGWRNAGDGYGKYVVIADEQDYMPKRSIKIVETRLYTNGDERAFAQLGQGWQEMHPSIKRLHS